MSYLPDQDEREFKPRYTLEYSSHVFYQYLCGSSSDGRGSGSTGNTSSNSYNNNATTSSATGSSSNAINSDLHDQMSLIVVGDVSVGKSTFIKEICSNIIAEYNSTSSTSSSLSLIHI